MPRDAGAISHHYDVSNRFYELVLGPSMTYTCACYPHAGAPLEVVGSWSDVSGRKQAEITAQATQARIEHLLAR